MIVGAITTVDTDAAPTPQKLPTVPIWVSQLIARATVPTPTAAAPAAIPSLTATKPPRDFTVTALYDPHIITTTAPSEPQGGVSINPSPPIVNDATATPTPINAVTGNRLPSSTTPTVGTLPAAPAATGFAALTKTEWAALAILAALVVL